MNKNTIIIFIIILALAIFLRIYNVGSVPIALFGDEIDVGLQAKSILETGKDYYNNPYPVMFHSFTEFRLPLFIYSAVPFIAIFGMTDLGVRLVGAFWGILGVIGIFLLAKQLFGKKVGLLAMALLTISPWQLNYSRQSGIEAGMLLTFYCFGLYCFLKGLKSFRWLVAAVVIFALSIYVYAISAFLLVFIGLLLIIVFRKELLKYKFKKLAILIMIGLIISLPFLNLTFNGKSTQRSSSISIISDKKINDEIVKRRFDDDLSFRSKVFHNKPLAFFTEFTNNYIGAFSPDFLFLKGDSNLRQSVANQGELYLFQMILVVVGIVSLYKSRQFFVLIIGLLLISPLASSITSGGGYHASRLIIMLIPLTILSALGLDKIWQELKKKQWRILLGVVIFLALIGIPAYFYRYYVDWYKDSWRFWQYGYKPAITYIKDNDSKYQRIFINNTYEPAFPRFLFYYNYDPADFQKSFEGDWIRKDVIPGFDGFQYKDKYFFGTVNNNDIPTGLDKLLGKGDLYMVSGRDEAYAADWRNYIPGNYDLLKTITDPYDVPIFYIITKK